MAFKRFKSLSVAVFSLFLVLLSGSALANEGEGAEGKFDPGKEMLDHIADAHEFHFFTIKHEGGHDFHATLPLPVILYSPQRGLSVFMSSKFHHGEEIHQWIQAGGTRYYSRKRRRFCRRKRKSVRLLLTKNVVQMFLALTVLFLILTGMAKKYKRGQGLDFCSQRVTECHRACNLVCTG